MRKIICLILLCFSSMIWAVDRGSIEYYLRDTDVRVIDDKMGTSIVLLSDHLFLEPDDPTINVEEYPALDEVLHIVKKHSKKHLIITAHTDNVAPQAAQYQQSYLQAKQMADYLVMGGVDPRRIKKVSGEGDQWPVGSNNIPQGRALNRRVEITLLSQCHCEEDRAELPLGMVIPEDREYEREKRQKESISIKGH